jgi:hypothetical protein
MLVTGIATGLAVFLKDQFSLTLNPGVTCTGLIAVVTYFTTQMWNDLKRVKEGLCIDRSWKDGKFWTALIAALIPPVSQFTGYDIPVEIAAVGIGTVSAVVGILVSGKKFTIFTGWKIWKKIRKLLKWFKKIRPATVKKKQKKR